jgi:hypothetical protein
MLIKDSSWVRQSFLVNGDDLEDVDFQNRIFTTASMKFTDTTPGGNFCINPPPQFTHSADLKAKGRFFKNHEGKDGESGMGRYYSEAIDDHNQIIHMRFGVPKFNSLTQFFTGFYNGEASQLARTGRSSSFIFKVGEAIGFVVPLLSWKLLLVLAGGNAVRFLMGKQTSKYYYLKPTMPLYWNAVQTMVNHIAVNRGIVPRVGGAERGRTGEDGYQVTDESLEALHNLLPEIFNRRGGVDVYAMANRAQRLARQRIKKQEAILGEGVFNTIAEAGALVQQSMSDLYSDVRPDWFDYLNTWFSVAASKPVPGADSDDKAASGSSPTTEKIDTSEESIAGFTKFFAAEMDDGSAFASFRVNSTGAVSESFSNAVTDSEIQNKINNMSSASRSTNFSFAGGNIDDGVIGTTLGAIAGAAGDLLKGVASGLGVSGLAALGGSAFVDIPKHWQSSSATLPRANYTIKLISPYGNPISQLLNIHIPLAMLLAGALPRSTGRQSYTSPFLLELYDRGRCQTRLGMIDSLSVSRGDSNLGFNSEGHPMSITVSFSVIDLSSILHMPITEGLGGTAAGEGLIIGGVVGAFAGGPLGAAAGSAAGGAVGLGVDTAKNVAKSINAVFDDDTVFTDYMAVLSGMSLEEQIYTYKRLKLNLTLVKANWQSYTSPAQFAGMIGDTGVSRLLSALYKGTAKQ